jgi:hypothetical protein
VVLHRDKLLEASSAEEVEDRSTYAVAYDEASWEDRTYKEGSIPANGNSHACRDVPSPLAGPALPSHSNLFFSHFSAPNFIFISRYFFPFISPAHFCSIYGGAGPFYRLYGSSYFFQGSRGDSAGSDVGELGRKGYRGRAFPYRAGGRDCVGRGRGRSRAAHRGPSSLLKRDYDLGQSVEKNSF